MSKRSLVTALIILFGWFSAIYSLSSIAGFYMPTRHAVEVTVKSRPATQAPRIIPPDYGNPYFTPRHD